MKPCDNSYCGWQYSLIIAEAMMLVVVAKPTTLKARLIFNAKPTTR
jgi:hypothetical protein